MRQKLNIRRLAAILFSLIMASLLAWAGRLRVGSFGRVMDLQLAMSTIRMATSLDSW